MWGGCGLCDSRGDRPRAFRRPVPLCEAPAEAAHEQVRHREHGPGERDKGRNRGERDDHERDQGETRHEREDDHRPEKDDAGRPFDSVLHDSTTFLV